MTEDEEGTAGWEDGFQIFGFEIFGFEIFEIFGFAIFGFAIFGFEIFDGWEDPRGWV